MITTIYCLAEIFQTNINLQQKLTKAWIMPATQKIQKQKWKPQLTHFSRHLIIWKNSSSRQYLLDHQTRTFYVRQMKLHRTYVSKTQPLSDKSLHVWQRDYNDSSCTPIESTSEQLHMASEMLLNFHFIPNSKDFDLRQWVINSNKS